MVSLGIDMPCTDSDSLQIYGPEMDNCFLKILSSRDGREEEYFKTSCIVVLLVSSKLGKSNCICS